MDYAIAILFTIGQQLLILYTYRKSMNIFKTHYIDQFRKELTKTKKRTQKSSK